MTCDICPCRGERALNRVYVTLFPAATHVEIIDLQVFSGRKYQDDHNSTARIGTDDINTSVDAQGSDLSLLFIDFMSISTPISFFPRPGTFLEKK